MRLLGKYQHMFLLDETDNISVYSVTVLDIIHTILITHNVYDIVAVHWGNPLIFLNLPWSTAAIAFPSVIGEHTLHLQTDCDIHYLVASEVQFFFAW